MNPSTARRPLQAYAWCAVAVGCAVSARQRPSPGPLPPPPQAAMVADAPREPPWTLVAPRGIPLPVEDLGALSHGEAVVIAHGGLYRWDGHGVPVSVCDATDDPPAMIEAEGDRFVALGGEEGAPLAWISDDRGASCEHIALPPLLVARSQPGRLGLSLDGAIALAWSTGGAIARSDDGGRTWRRLPDLAGVLRVDPAPMGAMFAAARVERSLYAREEPFARLYRLAPGAPRWSPVQGASVQRLPLVFQSLPDGTVRVVDGSGTVTLGTDGAVRTSTLEPAYRHAADIPRVLQRMGNGRTVGFSSRVLMTVDDNGVHPFAALPGLREPRIIDGDDGTVWTSDGLGLWRGSVDGPLEELTHRPFGEGEPVAMAARGDDLAVASDGGGLTRSTDGGAHWTRHVLPAALGRPVAVAFDTRGGLLVLGASGLAVSEGEAFVLTELPPRTGARPGMAFVTTVGDRWIVADGDLLTSDDQGAHWTRRLGPSEPGRSGEAVAAMSFHNGATGFVLRADHTLLRTDDGATSFHPVDAAASWTTPAFSSQQSLAWDGARSVAIMARFSEIRSRDGGAHFEAVDVPLTARLATFLSGGGMAAVAEHSPLVAAACHTTEGAAVLIETPRGWMLPPGSCQHRGRVFALDGAHLYVLDETGTLWHAALESIARETR